MNNQSNQAIGFLGGSFDPIHFGHLRPALEIKDALDLKTLFLMPNHIAPHKRSAHCSASQRLEMVKIAIQDQSEMSVDDRELQRHTASYTIDSLIELKKEYPNTPICFIMGMDSLISFDQWHRYQEILEYCHLVISHRPGWKCEFNETVQKILDTCKTLSVLDLHSLQSGKIFFQKTTQLEISSTEIRHLTSLDSNISYLLPDAVRAYIKNNELYKEI